MNLGYRPLQVDKALKQIDLTGDFEKDFRSSIKVIS
jgi:hypothetical protein